MRIANSAQLAFRLDRNLAWRKQELTQLKLTADSAPVAIGSVLRRSGVTLMYAHWEGFVKDASAYYLAYLTGNKIELVKLRSCFVAIALRSEIRAAGESKKTSAHLELIELIRSLDKPPPIKRRIPKNKVVSTRSNLKGAVLREITATLGIDYARFELKEKPVIDRLVQFRNSIAHGGGLPVSQADYTELHSEIIALMDVYKDLIQDAAANDLHLQ